jgi:hypothetical protein
MVQKPPKVVDKGLLESHLFGIQTKLFSRARPMYHPPKGLLISDISNLWADLEEIENERERLIRVCGLSHAVAELLSHAFTEIDAGALFVQGRCRWRPLPMCFPAGTLCPPPPQLQASFAPPHPAVEASGRVGGC